MKCAVHIYEGILSSIVDEVFLGIFLRNIKVLHIVAAEPEVNETHESTGRCDKEDAGKEVYVSGSTGNGLEKWAVLVLKKLRVPLPCDHRLAEVLSQVLVRRHRDITPCFLAEIALLECPLCLD